MTQDQARLSSASPLQLRNSDVEPVKSSVRESPAFPKHPITLRYYDSKLERDFLNYTHRSSTAATVYSVLGAIGFLAATFLANQFSSGKEGTWIAYLNVVAAGIFILIAITNEVAHRVKSIRRLFGYSFPLFNEGLSLIVGIVFLVPVFCFYPLAEVCLRVWGTSNAGCNNKVDPYHFGIVMWAVFGLDLRVWQTLPVILLIPVAAFAPIFIFDLYIDAPVERGGKAAVIVAATLTYALHAWAAALTKRSHFECWTENQRKEFDLLVKHEEVTEALRGVLPESSVSQLLQGRDVADFRERCTVGYFRIHDWHKFCTLDLQKRIVIFVDELTNAFDDLTCSKEFLGVSKVKASGDQYLSAINFYETDPICRLDLLLWFSIRQLNIAERVSQSASVGATGKIGVSTGTCVAALVGNSQLNYDVAGAAVSEARRLCNLASPGSILVSQESLVGTAEEQVETALETLCDREQAGDEVLFRLSVEKFAQWSAVPTPGRYVLKEGVSVNPVSTQEADQERRRNLRSRLMRKKGPAAAGASRLDSPDAVGSDPQQEQLDVEAIKQLINVGIKSRSTFSLGFNSVSCEEWYQTHSLRECEVRFRWLSFPAIATMLFLIILLTNLQNPTVAGNSLLGAAAALFLLYSAAFVVECLSRCRNAFVEVVATSTIGMLILLGTAFQQKTIFAGDFMFLQFYLSFYLLPPLLRLPWPVGILFSFVIAATANLSAYIRDGKPDYFVDRCLIVWATASACSYFQEKESRMVFQELKSSDLLRQGLQGEVQMQETLVHLIVPETVAMNVLEKYKSNTAKTFTQLLGELCVAGLRIEQAAEGVPIQNLESIRLRLDHALLNGSIRSRSSELIVQVLQTLGDELYLGGPLYRQKRQSDVVPATSAAFLEGLYEEGNEAGLWTALKTLLLALQELKGRGMQFSAALQVGSGIACVTGRVRPTFTVLGYAPNVVSALLEATPQQSVAVAAAVGDLLTHQRDPDLDQAGVRLIEATPWALRGIGLIRVHYIHFDSNVNELAEKQDK